MPGIRFPRGLFRDTIDFMLKRLFRSGRHCGPKEGILEGSKLDFAPIGEANQQALEVFGFVILAGEDCFHCFPSPIRI